MAERERKKNAAVYRSVSFKQLRSAGRSEELLQDRAGGLEAADLLLQPGIKQQQPGSDLLLQPVEQSSALPLAAHNFSVSRKVSKISATTAALLTAEPKRGSSTTTPILSSTTTSSTSLLSSISPAIRQLSEKFNTLPQVRGSRSDSSPARKSFHEDGGHFQDSGAPAADTLPDRRVQKFHSGTDSVSGSDSEKRSEKRILTRFAAENSNSSSGNNSGKRDYSQINACPSEPRKTLTTDEEEDVGSRGAPSPCKAHRSTHHSDFIPLYSDRWPSVTKIRQIFDERPSKSTCEGVKGATRGPELSSSESAPLLDTLSPYSSAGEATSLSVQSKIIGVQSSSARETLCHGMDFYPKADQHSNDEEPDIGTCGSNNSKVSARSAFQSSSSSSSSSRTGGSRYHRINSSLHRSHSSSAEAEAARKTPRTTGLTFDPSPDLQPPVTSSSGRSESLDTSSCSSSLQQTTVRERRDRQGVGLPRDSLHSSHSSSRAPAPTSSSSSAPPSSAPAPDKAITSSSSSSCSTVAPSAKLRALARGASPLSSRWRFSSGDEEEEHARRGGGWNATSGPAPSTSQRGSAERAGSYFSRSKNGWWGTKGIGRSSGSEEDSPSSLGPHGREAVRRRSLRKKKKVIGASPATGRDDYDDHDGESEDSDSDAALTMEHVERHHQQSGGGDFIGTASRSHTTREHCGHSHRARVQQWERISSTMTSATLPGVSRVSKVNIPPFASSPGGSRCSSRYSSTETLKEEDQASRAANSRAASSSVLSKTYHGNITMYRSPSFGHGDNFSRTPLRVRPKIAPKVNPLPGALVRDGRVSAGVRGDDKTAMRSTSVDGADDGDKNRISMSNPDITSETMSLLSFLKSDLSELKVRKTGGDKSGAVEGPPLYRMGSRAHGGGTLLPSGRRPSLKDLTATLRRAKSFTYSDKPATTVRCYSAASTAKRSSSEQQLDVEGERDGGRVSVSDREVESDGGDFRVRRGQRMRDYGFDDNDDDVIPLLQERYVQEARQVIHDICQMSTREDDDDVIDVRRNDADLGDECFQVKKSSKEKETAGMSVRDEARADQEAEFKNTKDRDKHERERENREMERGERGGQSEQLEKLNSRGTECREKAKRQSREAERGLLKGDSEESMFCDRSLDELSGHESSLTDEGIVTEPEMGPSDPLEGSFRGSAGVNLGSRIPRDVLGQPVTVWKQSALHEVEGLKQEKEDKMENGMSFTNRLNEIDAPPSLPPPGHVAESNSVIMDLNTTGAGEELNANSAVLQRSACSAGGGGGGLEAPATPSALRRRRKFSPSGSNNAGSDSSNGSNAESTAVAVGNGESTVYRSLSDPMPQRCCSVAEEGNNNFSSVDSNLLGSLSVKGGGGGPETSAVASSSEYKGSVASDLSVYSDSGVRDDAVQDYCGVIRSIVAEPGAMNRLMVDDHGNGKTHKKKSFSDPSRRSDAPLLSQTGPQFRGQTGSTQPISELDQQGQIPPSSSEPILSEQREELWEPEVRPKHAQPTQLHRQANTSSEVKKARSHSECTPPSLSFEDVDNDVIDEDENEVQKFNFDLKLAGVLSPRMVRRPGRKRPNRLPQFFPHEDPFEPPELQEDQCDLTPPLPNLQSRAKTRHKHVRHASEPASFIPISPPPHLQPLKEALASGKTPGEETPSLEDVTKKYSLELSAAERDTEDPGSPPVARDGASVAASEGPGETSSGGITEAGSQKKSTEETASTAAPQRTKPRVVSRCF